eukprot:Skav219542  [mRNA]  locus=scaffold2109:548:5400:- [translate_table: standard]
MFKKGNRTPDGYQGQTSCSGSGAAYPEGHGPGVGAEGRHVHGTAASVVYQCRLIDWVTHQQRVQYMLNLLGKLAPDGYSRVRMDQLLRADKELFLVMAEETDPRVTMHLLPLPAHRQAASSAVSSASKAAPPPAPVPGNRRQKTKTLKQSSKARTLCLPEPKDFKQTDDEGRPICWAFNTKAGCKEAVSGGKCKKGMRICIKCRRSNHSFVTCRAAGSQRFLTKEIEEFAVRTFVQDISVDSYSRQLAGASSPWHGKPLSQIVFVEIFAGSARLSRACSDIGVTSIAVDKTAEHTKGAHIFLCDVTVPAEFDMLVSLLEAHKDVLAWAHFAPAGNMASKAREKPLPKFQAAGIAVAQPCRSQQFPLGLPGLSGNDKFRTETANLVFEASAKLVLLLSSWGVVCSIENRRDSQFWVIPCIVALMDQLLGYSCLFDNCCHGGFRKKTTRWWCAHDWFLSLAAICPGAAVHVHKPWSPKLVNNKWVYPSSEEIAYPLLLCTRLAQVFKTCLLQRGVLEIVDLPSQQRHNTFSQHCLLLSALPRSKKYKPLVSEYGAYGQVVHSPHVELSPGDFPTHSRFLHQRTDHWGNLRVDAGENTIFHESTKQLTDDSSVLISTFGLPREPFDFADKAVRAGHPRGMAIHVSELVTSVLQENMEESPEVLALKRCKELAKWNSRAQELAPLERESGRIVLEPQSEAALKTMDDYYPSPSPHQSEKSWEFPSHSATELISRPLDQYVEPSISAQGYNESSNGQNQRLSAASGSWDSSQPGFGQGPEQTVFQNEENKTDGSDGETSDSSSDSSESSSAHEEQLQQRHGDRGVELDLSEPLYQHHKSRVLRRPNKAEGLLACGRRVGAAYKYLPDGSIFQWPRCSFCFKGEVISTVTGLVDALDRARESRQCREEAEAKHSDVK